MWSGGANLAPGPLGSVAGDPDRHRGWLLCPSSVPAAAGRGLRRPRVFSAHRPWPQLQVHAPARAVTAHPLAKRLQTGPAFLQAIFTLWPDRPSGQFGAGNSPRAGSNHPRGVRTEFDRRLARRRPPGGAAPQSESLESGGGAGRPVGAAPTPIPALHSCPSGRRIAGSCKSRRKPSSGLFKILASSFSVIGHSEATWSALSMGGAPAMALRWRFSRKNDWIKGQDTGALYSKNGDPAAGVGMALFASYYGVRSLRRCVVVGR
jgi:hypothetical protein